MRVSSTRVSSAAGSPDLRHHVPLAAAHGFEFDSGVQFDDCDAAYTDVDAFLEALESVLAEHL